MTDLNLQGENGITLEEDLGNNVLKVIAPDSAAASMQVAMTAPLALLTTASVIDFDIVTATNNANTMSANATDNTMTLSEIGRYSATVTSQFTLSGSTLRNVTYRIVNVANDEVLKERTISIKQNQNSNVEAIVFDVAATDLTVRIEVLAGTTGITLNSMSSLISLSTSATESQTLYKHYDAGSLENGLNRFIINANDVEMTLSDQKGYVEVKLIADATTRRPKIITESGITINGVDTSTGVNPLILNGTQADEYVLIMDASGVNFVLIALSDASFEFENQASGVITAASINQAGVFFGGSDGSYTATQVSSSGIGTGAIFTVVTAGDTVTSITSIDDGGADHNLGDLITVSLDAGAGTAILPCMLEVTAV